MSKDILQKVFVIAYIRLISFLILSFVWTVHGINTYTTHKTRNVKVLKYFLHLIKLIVMSLIFCSAYLGVMLFGSQAIVCNSVFANTSFNKHFGSAIFIGLSSLRCQEYVTIIQSSLGFGVGASRSFCFNWMMCTTSIKIEHRFQINNHKNNPLSHWNESYLTDSVKYISQWVVNL